MILVTLLLVFSGSLWSQEKAASGGSDHSFHALGVHDPRVEYLERTADQVPDELKNVAVEVHFDRNPTLMRFCMPCFPSQVTENNIHYSNGWTETYDPKASSSCEVLWDRDARYARMWIESQNDARIVVRVRAALADPDGYIAHSDIPSGSPYGEGDWTDEWYYIYPDGTHTRHVRIYTGLAGQSLTVTDEQFKGEAPIREIPPSAVHEFHEMFVFGMNGHIPEDDISLEPITLIKLDGQSKTFTYQPYPEDFGTFNQACIMVINTRSRYKPFTIFQPYGIENQVYPLEGEPPHVFQTWPSEPGDDGYSVSLGHTLNWWHYKRTVNILEQVYLSGMTASEDPSGDLTFLAKSWLHYPRLMRKGFSLSYTRKDYDPAQKAYVVPRKNKGPEKLTFSLGYPESFEEDVPLPVYIDNPVFIVENWGDSELELSVNDRTLTRGEDYEVGYESGENGIRLVLWLNYRSDNKTEFTLMPKTL